MEKSGKALSMVMAPDLVIEIVSNTAGVFQLSRNKDTIKGGKIVFWRAKGTDVDISFTPESLFKGLVLHIPDGFEAGVLVPFIEGANVQTIYEVTDTKSPTQAKVQDSESNDPEIIIEPIGN